MGWGDDGARWVMSRHRVTIRGWSLSSEHTAQHGQSLNITHVAVVIQPAFNININVKSVSSSLLLLKQNSQSLQQVASKRVSGPGGLSVGVRVWTQVLTGGC